MRWIPLVPMLFFLIACNSFPSKNENLQKDNRVEYRKDLTECKEDYPESAAGLHYQRWADCMRLKGWR